MGINQKITKIDFAIKSKLFQIYNDGILRIPRKWWQRIYIIYQWSVFEQILFLINFTVTLGFAIATFVVPHNFFDESISIRNCYIIAVISLIGNVTNIMSIILSSKKRISTFIWGVIACGTLGVASFMMRTIGTGMVYIIAQLPMQFVGFYLWRRQSINKIQVEPRRMKWWMIVLAIVIIASCTTGFYFLEKTPWFQAFWNNTPQTNPIALISDSLIFVLGTSGMLLMVMAFKEQWILWITLDVAMIILFSTPDNFNPQIIAMSSTAAINAVYGIWYWLRNTKLQNHG
jgi:nicotinamide mononucleotide transporter